MFLKLRNKTIRRQRAVAFALLFNTFSWYILGQLMMTKVGNVFGEGTFENIILGLGYSSSIIVFAIFGSVFLKKIRKTRFFYIWIVSGVLSSFFSIISVSSSLFASLAVAITLGISLGIGTPFCLSYFAESTKIENRGKIGGIIFLTTMFCTPFISILMSMLDLTYSALILAMWRIWSLPLLPFVSENKVIHESDAYKSPSLISVLHNRAFSLYFVAWLMFAFVDSFGSAVIESKIEEFRFFIKIVEPAFAGFSALIAGVLSDWIGRKRVIIFGFISLGIAYAIIGLLPQLWISWLFYFIIDGIALGLSWVLFVIVLWGDLSRHASEKFYAIGETPFFLTGIFSLVLAPSLGLIPQASTFSLAAFFLFLAVWPLLYAPETLPEKKIRERELKIYIDQAKKIKEKHA